MPVRSCLRSYRLERFILVKHYWSVVYKNSVLHSTSTGRGGTNLDRQHQDADDRSTRQRGISDGTEPNLRIWIRSPIQNDQLTNDENGARKKAGSYHLDGRSQLTPCATWGWRGGAARPLRSPGFPRPWRARDGARGVSPGSSPDVLMADHRTAVVRARVTPAEHADWQAKAAAAGVSLSRLLRQAIARTRTWTAAAAEVERETCGPSCTRVDATGTPLVVKAARVD